MIKKLEILHDNKDKICQFWHFKNMGILLNICKLIRQLRRCNLDPEFVHVKSHCLPASSKGNWIVDCLAKFECTGELTNPKIKFRKCKDEDLKFS